MAVIFQRMVRGEHVEVRSAGRTRRLYVDGVLHTQHNPAMPLTGDIWDPLGLSALLLPPEKTRRVLLLGVGGGAAIHLLRRFIQPSLLVGVELDELRIELARRYFGLQEVAGVQLRSAEAAHWLENYDGPDFDLIIDDLFGQKDGDPMRAIDLDQPWLNALLRPLTRHGILTINLPDRESMTHALQKVGPALRRRFSGAFRFSSPQSENAIVAFGPAAMDRQALRRRLADHPSMASQRAKNLVRFRIYALWP
ncbi:MAG: hypothetical protein JRH20_06450 [Deltaproteobacteria bacterium]|nr:hypothetical protein [Deltaproteobacteria bacterium]